MTLVLALGSLGDVDTIADRIRWVLENRKMTERELSERAGLSPVHIGKILNRGGERAGGETLAKIAKAGSVHVDWLITGEGPREYAPALTIEYDDRYPSRPRAIKRMEGVVSREAVFYTSSVAFDSLTDPGEEYWVRRLIAEEDRVRLQRERPEQAAREIREGEKLFEQDQKRGEAGERARKKLRDEMLGRTKKGSKK